MESKEYEQEILLPSTGVILCEILNISENMNLPIVHNNGSILQFDPKTEQLIIK